MVPRTNAPPGFNTPRDLAKDVYIVGALRQISKAVEQREHDIERFHGAQSLEIAHVAVNEPQQARVAEAGTQASGLRQIGL
jgi:hypothetical protein